MRRLIVSLLLFCANTQASPVIDYVYDGDTVKIREGLNIYKLRLTDIDAPERAQAYGLKSRRALMHACNQQSVKVNTTGFDKYGRTLGKLSCGKNDMALYMLQNGHAWFNSRFSHDSTLAAAEAHARAAHLGLWASKSPQSPWEWREKHPHHAQK